MSEHTTRTWTVEHTWTCGNHPCNTVNPFRNDKCSGCGQPKGAGHKEHVPTDMSYENRVKNTTRFDDKRPDWFCSYCVGHTRNPVSALVCKECGSAMGEKKGDARKGQDTTVGGMVIDPTVPPADSFWSVPSRGSWKDEPEAVRAVDSEVRAVPVLCADHPLMVDPETEKRRESLAAYDFAAPTALPAVPEQKVIVAHGAHYRDVKYEPVASNEWDEDFDPRSLIKSPRKQASAWISENAGTAGIIFGVLAVLAGIIYGCVWLFSWHPTTATVTETTWRYHVDLHRREVRHDSDWKNNEPAHAFNESCHEEIRSYHQCNPYQCNPHQVSFECNCRDDRNCTSRPVCSTSCSNSGNGSSSCSERCRNEESCTTNRVCQTCYRTEYDTCYEQCPDYDQKCEFDFPVWPAIQAADTMNTDHTLVRPELSAPGNVACPGDPETLYIANPGVTLCTVDSVRFHATFDAGEVGRFPVVPRSLSEYDRYQIGDRWNAQYNHTGMFRPMNRR